MTSEIRIEPYFAFGQSPFQVPEPIEKALAENANRGHHSAAEGILELREAIAEYNQRTYGLSVDPGRIVVGPGTKNLLHDIFYIVSGGVIIPSPSWIGYLTKAKAIDKHIHTFHLRRGSGYKIHAGDLDEFVTRLHREQYMLLINNPHNPTGAVYARGELEEIAAVCRKHNILVVADEIYALSTYDFSQFTSMAAVYPEGTFVTNGLSEDRSAGGYRLGYCILPQNHPERFFSDLQKVAATDDTNLSTPTQRAAVAAYRPNPEIDQYIQTTRQIHRITGRQLCTEFQKIEELQTATPEAGFHFFVDFNGLEADLKRKGVENSNALAESLLAHPHHIAAVTGDACMLQPDDYGARIAFADYDGRQAFENYLKNPPKTPEDEFKFVIDNAPRMLQGARALQEWVDSIKS